MKAKRNLQQITIWALLTNMLILVGLGNGTGFMVMIEIILVPLVLNDRFYFSLTDTYSQLLPTAALLSLISQVLFAISLFTKHLFNQTSFIFLALLFAAAGLVYLTSNAGHDNESITGMVTALPFVLASLLLVYHVVSNYVHDSSDVLRQIPVPKGRP